MLSRSTGGNNLCFIAISNFCMSLFNEVLDEFLENNPLPKRTRADLKIWAINLQSTYKKRLGQKGNKSTSRDRKLSSEQAKAMAEKRWKNIKND